MFRWRCSKKSDRKPSSVLTVQMSGRKIRLLGHKGDLNLNDTATVKPENQRRRQRAIVVQKGDVGSVC